MLVLKLIHVSQRGPCHSRSHYSDVIMGTMASQITSLTIVYSTVYSGGDQRKYQSSVSLAFVRGIHRWPVNSPHKWSVTRKRFPFDDVIMIQLLCNISGDVKASAGALQQRCYQPHQSESLSEIVIVGAIHRLPIDSPHKGPVMPSLDDVSLIVSLNKQLPKPQVIGDFRHYHYGAHKPLLWA